MMKRYISHNWELRIQRPRYLDLIKAELFALSYYTMEKGGRIRNRCLRSQEEGQAHFLVRNCS